MGSNSPRACEATPLPLPAVARRIGLGASAPRPGPGLDAHRRRKGKDGIPAGRLPAAAPSGNAPSASGRRVQSAGRTSRALREASRQPGRPRAEDSSE